MKSFIRVYLGSKNYVLPHEVNATTTVLIPKIKKKKKTQFVRKVLDPSLFVIFCTKLFQNPS